MNYVLPAFKAVSLIFACSAVYTGAQAILSPISFTKSFGIQLPIQAKSPADFNQAALSYVSLMGVRQLATGITLLIFAYLRKWHEMGIILAVLGIVVAGTDGVYLYRAGYPSQARFHAIPGAIIALLAATAAYTTA